MAMAILTMAILAMATAARAAAAAAARTHCEQRACGVELVRVVNEQHASPLVRAAEVLPPHGDVKVVVLATHHRAVAQGEGQRLTEVYVVGVLELRSTLAAGLVVDDPPKVALQGARGKV